MVKFPRRLFRRLCPGRPREAASFGYVQTSFVPFKGSNSIRCTIAPSTGNTRVQIPGRLENEKEEK